MHYLIVYLAKSLKTGHQSKLLQHHLMRVIFLQVMEPILPGNVVPLPVHLAETGQMRWRPMGNSHVWSEAQSLSHILTLPNQASVRSFVSYPVNPNNAIFRCCIMAQENVVTSVSRTTIADHPHNSPTYSIDVNNLDAQNLIKSKITNSLYMHSSTCILRDLVFQAPLLFKNCLPLPLTLTLESSAGLHLDICILQVLLFPDRCKLF